MKVFFFVCARLATTEQSKRRLGLQPLNTKSWVLLKSTSAVIKESFPH